MASSSGSGFTASIVNGIANYVSSDLSNLGMANGVSGSIQYVKMVWGASGESNLISDNAVDPSSLPVSLNTPENKFLTDALINGMTYTSGVTAFAVKIIDATGLSFGAVNVSMGSGVTIVGFAAGATNANLGVTFGPVGMSGGFLPITNRIIGGVTQSIQVTGGMYILGGTVSVTGLDVGSLSLNLTAGVTINGMTGDNKLGVTFAAATVSGTVDTHLKSIQSGVTLPVILTKYDGTFLGIGSGGSLLVSGVEGATAVGVTFDGTVGVTWVGGITGSVHILALPAVTGSVYINGTPTVKIDSTTNTVKIDSTTNTVKIDSTTNTVKIDSTTNTVKIEPSTTGTTFGVVFTNNFGTALGLSGATIVGMPVFGVSGATAINVMIVGGLSGITITGLAFPSFFGVSGGTIDVVRGGTLDHIKTIGSIGGGTINIANTVNVSGSISVSNLPTTQSVTVDNALPLEVAMKSGFLDKQGNSLIKHLEGLTVTLSGAVITGGLGDVTSIKGASMGFGVGSGMTGITGIGVTFASISVASLPSVTVISAPTTAIYGAADSRSSSPVGITFTGALAGLSGYGTNGALLGMTIVGVGMSGDSLKVSIVGGLSGITITGFAFPSFFGISGGTINNIVGGTINYIGTIGNISGGTVNIGNTLAIGGTVGIGNIASGVVFKSNLTDVNGVYLTAEKGIPVFGMGGLGATALGVTWSGTPTFGISGNVSVQQVSGTTFANVFTNNFGTALGLSGATVVGMPVFGFGLAGATAIGVTFAGISIVGTVATTASLSFPANGVTMMFANNFGAPLGLSGATIVGMPVFGLAGATAIGVTGTVYTRPLAGTTFANVFTDNFGTALGLSGATVVGMPVFGLAGATAIGVTGTVYTRPLAGTTFANVFTNNFGVALGLSGATVVGMPVFGLAGATAIGVTGTISIAGASYDADSKAFIGVWNTVLVDGLSTTNIGVTFAKIVLSAEDTVNNEIQVKTKTGTLLGVTGTVSTKPLAGTTFANVFTDNFGVALGLSGATVVGMPVFGLAGATAIGVTFGAITFGAAGMGVTFAGITFNTTKTIITGTSFASGGGNLGMPVFGVMGATALQVTVIGGTISGIFTTEAQGITITGVTTGIPVFGVLGATAIGVTFSAGSIGTTFGGITGSVHILGLPAVTGSVYINGTPTVVVGSGTITSITEDVNVAPASAYRNTEASNTVLAGRTAAGFVTTQKAGSNFARGLTLDANFIGQTTYGLQFGDGATIYYLKSSPVCVTKDYIGPGRIIGVSVEGNQSVPLKVGLYIQLTKWDLISHVLVGYTAGTTQEFARNAQTLTREYQVAPIWGNAMEQFRKYAGASGNSSSMTDVDVGDPADLNDPPMVQKQFVGVIEKPTRLFIPCKDAGEVYVQVIGDYTNHAIGSGFWTFEGATAQWSAHTLYERGYYASDYSGIANGIEGYPDGNPDLSLGGDSNFGVGSWLANSDAGIAVQKIIDSYANNPFIRIWGH